LLRVTSRNPRFRLLFAAVLALGAVFLAAAPASAHAVLESTDPVGGTAVATSPERVVLRFSESVQIPLGSIRVFASPSGEQVETGSAGRADGQSDAVAVKLPKLDKGAYIVTWRVTSADAHPIHGAFTFTVGSAKDAAANAALVEKLLSSGGGDTAVGAIYAVIRFAAFASLVLLVGGLAFVALLWPAGAALARTRRILWTAWTVALVTTAVGIPIQAVYAAGLPISKVLSSTVRSGMLGDRFGEVWSVRLVLLGLTAALLAFLFRSIPVKERQIVPRGLLVGGGLLSVGLLMTPGLAGHAAAEDLVPLAMTADVLHLAAVSVWLGGLALLAVAVLPRGVADELAQVVPRFSRAAFVAVITILATGSFQGWRQVRSTAALTETTYGRLLIIKVVLFAAIVALGGLSRRLVQARYRVPAARLSFGPGAATLGGSRRRDRGDTPRPPGADPDSEAVGRLRRTVGAETVIAVVVLAVTALLVNAQPARSALAKPFSAEMRSDMVLVDVTVDPAKTGPADFHLYTLSPQGGQQDVQELTATLTLPSQDVGPLALPVTRAGPGHFSAYNFTLPLKGDWKLEIKALLSEIDEATVSTTIPVK
jgi:copper transport protein